MKPFKLIILALLINLFTINCISSAAETASAGVENISAPPALTGFAALVVDGNRNILASEHDLESAMFEKHKALAAFSPDIYFSSDSSKSANRSFNPITGIEEDYSTRRQGSGAGIVQRTPLGRLSYDYSRSKTEYTSSRSSYFQSLYLSWQAGLLRHDAKLDRLERRMAHAGYEISRAQSDSAVLDVLMGSFQSLFGRIVADRNQKLKQHNLSFYRTLVEEAEIKLKNGMGSELDLKQASMRLQQAETGYEETALAVNETDRRLSLQMGRTVWQPEVASFSTDEIISALPGLLDADELVATALKKRPDYRVFESQYQAQKASLARFRELSRPDLTARARWGKQGRGFEESAAAEMRDKSWDVAVTYSFSFGPEEEKLTYSSQQQKLKAFESRLEQKREEVVSAVKEAHERLEFYRRNHESLKASEKLSGEVLEGQRLNFQLGKISLLDLSRYQQEYDNASLALVQGETRLILEWLRLLYETGTLADYAGVKKHPENSKALIVPVEAADK